MKQSVSLMILLLSFICVASATADTRLMLVTDLHYLAPELYDTSGYFERILLQGDGKVAHESETLLNALKAEVAHQAPDALLISGDLTFNGETASHVRLAGALREIEEAGTPVYVIPGNHDLNILFARGYFPDGITVEKTLPSEAYPEIYQEFLPSADDRSSARMGGTARVGDVTLLFLDGCVYEPHAETYGVVPEATLNWLRETLEAHRGETVVTISHHSLIPHSSYMQPMFVLQNTRQVMNLLQAAGVRLHLSGHLHLQHIAEEDSITDAATAAFCIYPHTYAMITVGHGQIQYNACGLCPEHLPEGFTERSADFFMNTTAGKLKSWTDTLPITEEQKQQMLDYAMKLNLQYFSGTIERSLPYWTESEAASLWKQYADGSQFADYMNEILQEKALPARSVVLSLP